MIHRTDKVFSRVHSLILSSSIEDQQANLNYLQGDLIQDSIQANFLLKSFR